MKNMRDMVAGIVEKSKSKSSSMIESIVESAGFHQLMAQSVTPQQYAEVVAFAIESWPEALRSLSFPSASIEISPKETLLLTRLWGEVDLGFDDKANAWDAWERADDCMAKAKSTSGIPLRSIPLLAGLEKRIDDLLTQNTEAISKRFCEIAETEGLPKPSFVPEFLMRLGTASPKDSPFWGLSKGRVSSGAQALLMLMTSPRGLAQAANDEIMQTTLNNLDTGDASTPVGDIPSDQITELLAAIPEHSTWLWFRLYQEFEEFQEFRCFMKNGEFAGGTQYHGIVRDPRNRYLKIEAFPELVEHGYEYEKIILDWFPKFREAAGEGFAGSCCFDVIVDRHRKTVRLVEINPVSRGTFPGLLDWERPETFNGEVSWAAANSESHAPHIKMDELKRIAASAAVRSPRPVDFVEFTAKTKSSKNLLDKMLGWIISKSKAKRQRPAKNTSS